MKAKKPTLEDVGRLAGVSRQTVSRVINGQPLVSAEARRRVLDAMERLDYRPDPVGRSLATRRTFLIGVFTTSFVRYIPALTLEGVEEELRDNGFQLFVSRCEETGGVLSAPLARNQPIEGALIVHHGFAGQSTALLEDLPADAPIVSTGFAEGLPRVVSLTVDNEAGGRRAADHLASKGRRRCAMITGPPGDLDAKQRTAGFLSALREIDGGPTCVVKDGNWSYELGYASMQELLARDRSIDGVFAQNDPTAIGAIRAIHESGRRVPDDIAVIGFDDIPSARYVEPALTTLRNPAFELGKISASLLVRLIAGEELRGLPTAHERARLEPELVVRESC